MDAIERWVARLGEEGVFCRQVSVDYASHSAEMDPILAELEGLLSEIAPQAGQGLAQEAAAALVPHRVQFGEPVDAIGLAAGGQDAHRTRTLGSISEYAMSTARFTSMKMTAKMRMKPIRPG